MVNARLKIQDLNSGNQPFIDESRRYAMVYNGELYNKDEIKDKLSAQGFSTTSDTEVVFKALIQFGKDAFKMFNGMFAIAFYDAHTDELLLARDRFGVKPLHYYHEGANLGFASEIKSLTVLMPRKQLNLDGARSYLQTNYIHDGTSIFNGVQALRPAQILRFKNGKKSLETYWEAPTSRTGSKRELDESLLEDLIKQAVARQLIGERDVGVFLSSGIDSATIAYYAKQSLGELTAYNVSFAHPDFDESAQAQNVARQLGLNFKKLVFSPSMFMEGFESYVKANSQPIADLGMYPLYQLAAFAKDSSTVILSGDGADEIFCGYPTLKADALSKNYQWLLGAARTASPLIKGSLGLLNKKSSWDYRFDKLLKGSALPGAKAHFYWRTVFDNQELAALGFDHSYEVDKEYLMASESASGLEGYLLADFKVWLPCNNFQKTDIATMAHSIEARVPFLDNALVDYAFSLDFHQKWSFFSNKKLLRNAMRGKLPNSIVKGKKAAFHPPYTEWFKNDLYEFSKKNLKDSLLAQTLGIKEEAILNLLAQHKNGERNNAYKIYNLLFLEFWMRSWL